MKQRISLTKSEERRLTKKLLCAVIFIGIFCGSIFFSMFKGNINSIILKQNISPLNINLSVLDFFKSTALIYIIYMIIFGLCGMFVFGQAISIFTLLFRGFSMGIAISSVYASMGLKALVPLIILVIPKLLAVSVIFILASRESVKMSNKIFSFILSKNSEDNMKSQTKLYLIKFAVLLFFILLISFGECAMNYFFIDLCY